MARLLRMRYDAIDPVFGYAVITFNASEPQISENGQVVTNLTVAKVEFFDQEGNLREGSGVTDREKQ